MRQKISTWLAITIGGIIFGLALLFALMQAA